MKCTTVIDKERDEEVIIYAKERTPLTEEIEALCNNKQAPLVGYCGADIVPLRAEDVTCFTVEDGRVFAICEGTRFRINERLYQLESSLGQGYVKINQSCLANIGRIERFSATIGGSLAVIFKDGHRDFISRRQMKTVKERIGFKL